MDKISIMPEQNFRAISAWFAGTTAADQLDNLELIIVEKKFPNVVNLVCGGKPRYFIVAEELVNKVAKNLFKQIPITPDEGEFLDCIKSQIEDGRFQVHLEANTPQVLKIAKLQPNFVRAFEAPSLKGGDFKRYAVEYRLPQS